MEQSLRASFIIFYVVTIKLTQLTNEIETVSRARHCNYFKPLNDVFDVGKCKEFK